MRNFTRSAMLGLVVIASGASALPLYRDRFVHEKSGYVVETQEVGTGMKLTGRHPVTGSTFRLKVSRSGKVTGLWNGRPVEFVLDKTATDVQLAKASIEGAGAN